MAGWPGCCCYVVLSLLLSASSCAGQACQIVELVSGVNRHETVYTDKSDTGCGYVPEVAEVPTAPLDLKFKNYPYPVRDEFTTLAVNMTWKLPENSTGLQGFVVEVMKTSYPIRFPQCLKFTLPEPTLSPQSTSVDYTFECWHNLDVDGTYDVTVRSLPSGQSIKRELHTANCAMFPEVGGCLDDCKNDRCRTLTDDWRPQNPPSVLVFGDQVIVNFDIYPGDRWLVYRVNLHSYELSYTPDELSHLVNTSGRSGRYAETFEGVKPGRYKATVKIFKGDAIQASSEDFVVVQPTVPVVTETTEFSTSSGDSDQQASNSPTRNDVLKMLGIGVGSAVFAVLLLAAMVIWKRQKWRGSQSQGPGAVGGSPFRGSMAQSEDTSDLVKNMHHNDLTATSDQCGQNNDSFHKEANNWPEICQAEGQADGESYLQGSIWTDLSAGPYVHTVDMNNRSICDQWSFGGEPGIAV